MQERDFEVVRLQTARNDLEAFIFEMRAAPRRKYGELIKADELNKLMDDCENWLWDNQDVSLDALEEQSKRVRTEASVLCKEFDDANEKERFRNRDHILQIHDFSKNAKTQLNSYLENDEDDDIESDSEDEGDEPSEQWFKSYIDLDS